MSIKLFNCKVTKLLIQQKLEIDDNNTVWKLQTHLLQHQKHHVYFMNVAMSLFYF